MKNEKNAPTELTPIAYKSKGTVPLMIYGVLGFTIAIVIKLLAKSDLWYLDVALFAAIVVVCAVVLVSDIKRPEVVIAYANEQLYIGKRNGWTTVKVSDGDDVMCWHDGDRIAFASGGVRFKTKQGKITVYNLAEIEKVKNALQEICGLTLKESKEK